MNKEINFNTNFNTFKSNILGTRILNNNLIIATEQGCYKFINNKFKKIKFKDKNKIIQPSLIWIDEIAEYKGEIKNV